MHKEFQDKTINIVNFDDRFKVSTSLLLGWLLCILLASTVVTAQPQQLDRIEIIVGNHIILASDIKRSILQAKQELYQQNIKAPADDILRKRVEEDLINKALQMNEAEQYGMSISEQQLIDATIALAQQNGLQLDQLRQQIEDQGDDFAEFLQELRQDLLIQQYQQQRLQSTVRITDEEITRFLATKEAEQLIGNEYLVNYISLPKTEEGDALKQKIRQELDKKVSFTQLAQQYSNARNALTGGNLDWRKSSNLPTVFSEVVEKMERGDINFELERGDNQLIMMLTDIRGDSVEYGEEYNLEHIMISPNQVRTEDSVESFIEALKLQIENGESFDLLARTHSDDPTSQNDGGKLNWLLANQLPSPLDTEITKLQVNEISKPLRSTDGWHIMRYTDKRLKNLTEENLRSRAVNVIFSTRYEEELNRLLKQLKEEAYIKHIYEESS